jgi:hypothetical protein
MFRGFGPSVIAITGFLAVGAAAAQSLIYPALNAVMYVAVWTTVAVVSAALIGAEMIARSRRHHGGLADAMLLHVVEHFVPVGAAGAVLCAILLKFAPDQAWLLPGLWQMLLGVGLFVTMRFLPRSIALAAAWYFLAGATVLILASQSRTLTPWMMGIPFGVGQLMMAALLHVAMGGDDEQN